MRLGLWEAKHSFQSTSPVRGTTGWYQAYVQLANISIHVPREGDDNQMPEKIVNILISIHVPREGDDQHGPIQPHGRTDFNPRPP